MKKSNSENDLDAFIASGSFMNDTIWIIDCGASYHMRPDMHSYSIYHQFCEGEGSHDWC